MAIQGAINTILGSTAAGIIGVQKILGDQSKPKMPAMDSETNGAKDEEMRAKALQTAQQKINSVYKTNMSVKQRNAVVKDI